MFGTIARTGFYLVLVMLAVLAGIVSLDHGRVNYPLVLVLLAIGVALGVADHLTHRKHLGR